jgi:hypothetical protein
VTLEPSWFPAAGAPVGAALAPAANAAEAAVAGRLRFFARMRGAAYLLHEWFWVALVVIGGGLAAAGVAAGVAASAAARAWAGAAPGVGVPFPAAAAAAIRAALRPHERDERRRHVAAAAADGDDATPPLPQEDALTPVAPAAQPAAAAL